MQAFLKKHGPGHASHIIKTEWELKSSSDLLIQFTASKRTSRPWLSDPVFTHDWSKNWGLWNKDVLEAFLQLRSHSEELSAPYLEIQVSPLNQPFALIITEPRKIFRAPRILDFIHEVELEGRQWKATMEIKLPDELRGDLLYGGFFACLDQEPREFFALEPNTESSPDFHRPELFIPLSVR